MNLPASIQPKVSASLITRVTRLYNGTIADCLHELLQNARRAGASAIIMDVEECDGAQILSIADDGCGIDDPRNLLTLGQSGWEAEIAAREDPAGMGVFSLAGRHVTVRSWSQSAHAGWQVTIPEHGWEGAVPLAIEPAEMDCGTLIRVTLPSAWAKGLEAVVRQVASYFPLPVHFCGKKVEREDFLAEALHIEVWRGLRIGIFRSSGRQHWDAPRINFHGVTVPCRHDPVEEVDGHAYWNARVDILDAPALQLVLPARKEMVENEALSQLRCEMEAAIYRAIALQPGHRLSFASWQRAAQLGITLPEASAWLDGWVPAVADNTMIPSGGQVASGDMMIVHRSGADLEQAAAAIIRNTMLMGLRAVDGEPAFEGYGWYDRLPRITAIDFTFEHEGQAWIYGDSAKEYLPHTLPSGRVTSLLLELTMADSGHPDAAVRTRTFEVPMLVANNETYSLDEALILIAKDEDVDPGDLATLMEASLFCASEDADCDSWQTQNEYFCTNARNLANTLLLGEEQALIARLREAVREHVVWLIPYGREMVVTASPGLMDLVLSTPD